jgi:hypothetical protein
MKTCGMMGEVVGKAASICAKYDCLPRDVYESHLGELTELLKLPGKAHRKTVRGEIVIPKDIPPLAGPYGPPTGLDPAKLEGLVIDDKDAVKVGKWSEGQGLKGYVGWNYLYAGNNSKASVRFEFKAPQTGKYDLRIAYLSHENRGDRVPVTVRSAAGTKTTKIDMRKPAPLKNDFYSLGEFSLKAREPVSVTISTENAGGNAHADALQVLPVK